MLLQRSCPRSTVTAMQPLPLRLPCMPPGCCSEQPQHTSAACPAVVAAAASACLLRVPLYQGIEHRHKRTTGQGPWSSTGRHVRSLRCTSLQVRVGAKVTRVQLWHLRKPASLWSRSAHSCWRQAARSRPLPCSHLIMGARQARVQQPCCQEAAYSHAGGKCTRADRQLRASCKHLTTERAVACKPTNWTRYLEWHNLACQLLQPSTW